MIDTELLTASEPCVCGHVKASHEGHTTQVGSEPSRCCACCACREFASNAPSFEWSNARYKALKAAKEFSENTTADYET